MLEQALAGVNNAAVISTPRVLYEACPICSSGNIAPDKRFDCTARVSFSDTAPKHITWMKCRDCGHSFTDGYFTESMLSEILQHLHDNQIFQPDQVEPMRQVSAKIVQKVVTQTSLAQGKWLDIGFGNAALLTTCQEFGFEPVGRDLRQEAVDAINKYGFSFSRGEISDDSHDGEYSVVSLADVLEHAPYPLEMLKDAHRLLKKGGAIFVSCPNRESFIWKILTDASKNPYWAEVEHYHNFGRSQLFGILGDMGFGSMTYSISERYRMGMEITAIKG